ncbi:MAG: hypothetical protein JSV67_04890 [Thermoplasmatales archaeon]|nr:MAG: hypothetical protein JSV67_04890 [Thermoplasmatales archaeon]
MNNSHVKIFSVIILFFIGVSITSVSGNFDLSENNTIIFDFTFQNPKISQIEINGKVYDEILIEGLENSYYKNQPCLPMQPVKILIPVGKEADYIEVITSEKITLGYTYNIRRGGNLIPIIQTETSDNKEEITELLIQESLIYENMGIFIFRGFPILHINLYPVQYDSTTGEASYFKNIKLVINIKDSFESQSIRGLAKDLEIVKQKVDNPQYVDTYKPLKKTTTMDTIDYIIITSLNFKNYNGQNNFQDLLNLKESKGLNTDIVTVEEIMINNAYRINGEWGDGNPSNPFYQSQITRNE